MRRIAGSGSGRQAAESMTQTHRIQQELARVAVEAQRSLQEAVKGSNERRLEHMRGAVLRVEAAMADVFAAVAGLTRREVEVYRLERVGYGAEGIGERLMIQPGTVRTHLKRLRSKLVAAELRVPNVRSTKGEPGGDHEAEGR